MLRRCWPGRSDRSGGYVFARPGVGRDGSKPGTNRLKEETLAADHESAGITPPTRRRHAAMQSLGESLRAADNSDGETAMDAKLLSTSKTAWSAPTLRRWLLRIHGTILALVALGSALATTIGW